jgi:hypothetical protein
MRWVLQGDVSQTAYIAITLSLRSSDELVHLLSRSRNTKIMIPRNSAKFRLHATPPEHPPRVLSCQDAPSYTHSDLRSFVLCNCVIVCIVSVLSAVASLLLCFVYCVLRTVFCLNVFSIRLMCVTFLLCPIVILLPPG